MDPLAYDRRTQGHVAGRDPLGGADDVGLHTELVERREHVAETAEGGNDLVSDIQHLVPAADLRCSLVVAPWRYKHSAGAHDGLGNERRHALRPKLYNAAFELGDEQFAIFIVRQLVRLAVEIGGGDVAGEPGDAVEVDLR